MRVYRDVAGGSHDSLLLHSDHVEGCCRSGSITSQQWSVRADHARAHLPSSRPRPVLRQLPATHNLSNVRRSSRVQTTKEVSPWPRCFAPPRWRMC